MTAIFLSHSKHDSNIIDIGDCKPITPKLILCNYPCELFLYISSLSIHQGMAFAREWFQSKDGRHVSIRDYSLNAIATIKSSQTSLQDF